ncbi:aminoglycoside phosphotransferase family protein [bacterium]|nr:aminoglycoside phosphotransferase family protein [bacterium]
MTAAAELGADLAALVEAVGRPLVAAIPLSRRGPARVATAFRLRFADGRTLKGVRTLEAATAARVAALIDDLGALAPRLIAHGGEALLTEWVEGQPLAAAGWPAALLRRCGAAQARVHARARSDADPAQAAGRCAAALRSDLDALVAGGSLAEHEGSGLLRLARRHAPARGTTTVALGDYCADNIVCRPDGELRLVDLETVAVAPSEYDLGRTWYRWPMTPAQRAAYLDGYRAHCDPDPFLAHLPFWHMVALVQGAAYRQRQGHADVGVPLAGLRQLLADADR